MIRNRTPVQITRYWQDEVDQDLEAGSAPVLELGAGNLVTDDAASMLAVQKWTALRTDISTPFLPSGGMGPQWLASLLRPLPRFQDALPPEATVVYGGSNEVEYLASASLLHAATLHDNAGPQDTAHIASDRGAAIPVSYFTPNSQPGLSVSWDALPFLSLFPPPAESAAPLTSDHKDERVQGKDELSDDAYVVQSARAPRGSEDPLQDWLAWSGLLLALFLVLLAVLV